MAANSFCTLTAYSSIEEALVENLDVSKSQVKKRSELSKEKLGRSVHAQSEIEIPSELFNYGLVNPVYVGPEIEIIDMIDPFIVLNKPAQIHSHPLHYSENDNVLSFLRSYSLDKTLGKFSLTYDRGLLHRLDYETSGILLYSKDESTKLDYFHRREELILEKTYAALVPKGILKVGMLSHQIDLNSDKVKLARDKKTAKTVSLEILKVISGDIYDLVKIKLFGGARHQIRVQLSLAGAPIIGDELYGLGTASRLFLHSYSYTLVIGGKAKTFVAALPSAFNTLFHFDGIF